MIGATWEFYPKVTFDSLADEFRRNPQQAWRNYGSVLPKVSVGAAIREASAVLNRVNLQRTDPWDAVRDLYRDWFRGKPGLRYFMHFDLSKNQTATGIALAHVEAGGLMVVDLMRRHVPTPGHNINYGELRERYIYPLTARGFHIQLITFDGFQSDETRSVLQERGYATDYCSADRTTGPYDTLLDLLSSGKLDFYNHPMFVRELEALLLIDGKKYDHPKKFSNGEDGSKDVSDAVACSAYMAIGYGLDHPTEAAGLIKVHPGVPVSYGERSVFG